MSKPAPRDRPVKGHGLISDAGGRPSIPTTPEGWDVLRIGEMFSRRTERGREGLPVMSITMSEGLVERDPVERRVDSNLPPEGHLLVRAGDLAYNMMRMWQGVLGRGKYDCLVSPAYIVLQPSRKVEPEFAEYLFSTKVATAAFKRLSYGVVDDRLRLYYRDLVRVQFSVPRSLTEQRRISQILSTLNETIGQTEELIAKYRQVKAGLMQDLFSRGITSDGCLRPTHTEAPALYKSTSIGWLPNEWDLVQIGESFDIQLGKMLSQAAKTGRNEALYLGNRNVQWDRIDTSGMETMDFTAAERLKFQLLPGDLLVCEGGDVGRTALWSGEIEHCYYQKAIHRLRPKTRDVLPSYMLRFMRFARDRGYFREFTSQSSIAHLTQEKLAKVSMLKPPRDEQVRIATRFDAVDEVLFCEQDLLAKLRLQKLGLMHDLLIGCVRVGTLQLEEVAR